MKIIWNQFCEFVKSLQKKGYSKEKMYKNVRVIEQKMSSIKTYCAYVSSSIEWFQYNMSFDMFQYHHQKFIIATISKHHYIIEFLENILLKCWHP